SIDFNDIHIGDAITPMRIDATATVIVAGAIATRDFMPVHHDRSYANLQGAPDIFMNILTSNGYCSRFLTDWVGPDAMVKRITIRLGVPATAGCTLEFTGTVTGTSRVGDEGIVEVELRASTETGDHLSGTAVLSLPLTGARA